MDAQGLGTRVAAALAVLLSTAAARGEGSRLAAAISNERAVETSEAESAGGGGMDQAIDNILQHCLRPPAGREIVVIHDSEKEDLARRFSAVLEERGHPVSFFVVGEDVGSSKADLERLLANDEVGLVLLTSPRMFHGLGLGGRLEFRDGVPSIRADSHPVFFDTVIPTENLVRLYSADPEGTDIYLARLRGGLREHAGLRLTTPAGTDLVFRAREWKKWPWEIATYPVEASVNGTIVVDGAVFFSQVTGPIRLEIGDGKLTRIDCDRDEDAVCRRYRDEMDRVHGDNPLNWQLAEVGLGGNSAARLGDVLMESESVRDTAHFCFGESAEFGGENETGWHGGTVVVRAPFLELADDEVE